MFVSRFRRPPAQPRLIRPVARTFRFAAFHALRRAATISLWSVTLAAVVVVTLRVYTVVRHRGAITTVASAPAAPTAIVFGAGLTPSGAPSPVLYDRVATAAELYHAGKAQRLLLSGDHRDVYYDEPAAMRRVAITLGVPETALLLDDAGLRTYETCARAGEHFGVSRALLVTQRFHLPRSLMTCDALGIKSTGVSADRPRYPMRYRLSWEVRETVATSFAWWDVITGIPARPRPDAVPAS